MLHASFVKVVAFSTENNQMAHDIMIFCYKTVGKYTFSLKCYLPVQFQSQRLNTMQGGGVADPCMTT